MPFTPAHPAAILPVRKRLVLSALVIGAMAPDFHYFMGLGPHGKVSHTFAGAFYFCVPVGLAALWLFHKLLKLPLISLSPEWHQARLARFAVPFRFGPARRFVVIVGSLLVGIFSHLLWDSFTHGGGWMVRHIPALRTVVFPEMAGGRPLYNLLQHGCTLLGLLALAVAYYRWARTQPPQPVPDRLKLRPEVRAGLIGGGLGMISAISASYGFDRSHHGARFIIFVAYAVIAFCGLAFACLLAFSLWWHAGRRTQQSAVSSQHSAP